MSLSANTNVASTVANYFSDNYTALLQAGTAVPATAYTAPATQAFADWKLANNDKKFFLEKSGESYKLGSVTGNTSIPQGAEAVDLNVAYAIESKEMTLVDWMMAKIGDEMRRDNALQAFGSVLSFAPEADVNFDPSSMSQADLQQLLKRLSRASDDLKATTALGDAADRQSAAAMLGLSATLLGAAMEQQALFQEEAATLSTGSEAAAVGSAQTGLTDAQATRTGAQAAQTSAQSSLTSATSTRDTAKTNRDEAKTVRDGKAQLRDEASSALQAAQAPESNATPEQIQQFQTAYDSALTEANQAQATLNQKQTDLDAAEAARTQADTDVTNAQTAATNAQTAVNQAQTTLTQAQASLEAADNFNEAMSAAYAQLVAGLTSEMEAAQVAYSQTAASTVSSSTLSGLTSAAGGALNSRLKSAADVALLTNPNVALFSALDVQETDDGYVVNTSGMSSRDAQKAAVRAALEEALSDPALQTALADAMAANADSLGTADMALPDQTKLYNEVAAALISGMRSNDGYLDELASNAVDFGNQLSQMLGNELVSASKRDNALMSAMN